MWGRCSTSTTRTRRSTPASGRARFEKLKFLLPFLFPSVSFLRSTSVFAPFAFFGFAFVLHKRVGSMCRSLGRKKRDSELSEEVEDEVFFLLFKASITFNSLSLSRTLLLLRSPRSFLVESSEGFYLNMRFASAAVSSSPPLAAAAVRSRRSSSSTAVAVSSMPSRRRFRKHRRFCSFRCPSARLCLPGRSDRASHGASRHGLGFFFCFCAHEGHQAHSVWTHHSRCRRRRPGARVGGEQIQGPDLGRG